MTDQAWSKGMGLLLALGLPGWSTDPAEADLRASKMRETLDDLSDEQWLHGCRQAANLERWFPTVAALREYAEAWRPQYPMLPPARNPEAKARDREEARRGVELIRQTLLRAGIDPGAPKGDSVTEVAAKVRMLEGQAEKEIR